MSESTVRRILHKDFRFQPYKMIVQTLNEGDWTTFSLRRCNGPNYPTKCGCDHHEWSNFNLNGSVNKHIPILGPTISPWNAWMALHSPKLTAWCAISRVGIISPYFLRKMGLPWLNSVPYIDMINDSLVPELQSRRINNRNVVLTSLSHRTHCDSRNGCRSRQVNWSPHFMMWCFLASSVTSHMIVRFCRTTLSHVYTKKSHEH